MSLSTIAQDLAVERWPGARVHLRHYGPRTEHEDGTETTRAVLRVWRYEHPADETVEVTLALASGPDSGQAWTALIRATLACDRDEPEPLTTEQTAAVLGVTASRVRQLVMAGALVPLPPGRQKGVQGWFAPGDVWRLLESRVAVEVG